jgi:superfamily I DNA/RNA helicase
MIQFRDFVPEMLAAPALFKAGEYESMEAALAAANAWIKESDIQIVNIETVVLPNIWSRYEEGTTDVALGTSGEMPSHWHQFVRVWYRAD